MTDKIPWNTPPENKWWTSQTPHTTQTQSAVLRVLDVNGKNPAPVTSNTRDMEYSVQESIHLDFQANLWKFNTKLFQCNSIQELLTCLQEFNNKSEFAKSLEKQLQIPWMYFFVETSDKKHENPLFNGISNLIKKFYHVQNYDQQKFVHDFSQSIKTYSSHSLQSEIIINNVNLGNIHIFYNTLREVNDTKKIIQDTFQEMIENILWKFQQIFQKYTDEFLMTHNRISLLKNSYFLEKTLTHFLKNSKHVNLVQIQPNLLQSERDPQYKEDLGKFAKWLKSLFVTSQFPFEIFHIDNDQFIVIISQENLSGTKTKHILEKFFKDYFPNLKISTWIVHSEHREDYKWNEKIMIKDAYLSLNHAIKNQESFSVLSNEFDSLHPIKE